MLQAAIAFGARKDDVESLAVTEHLPRDLPGTKWRLCPRLGSGGYADVYAAEHVELEHRVAVKLLHARFSNEQQIVLRLRQEARMMAKLRHHPTIVRVEDFGRSEDGRTYITMDLVEGKTLRQVIAERGRLSFDEAATMGVELAEGLHVAHLAGIIHRDVKPENMMVGADGRM